MTCLLAPFASKQAEPLRGEAQVAAQRAASPEPNAAGQEPVRHGAQPPLPTTPRLREQAGLLPVGHVSGPVPWGQCVVFSCGHGGTPLSYFVLQLLFINGAKECPLK